MMCQDQFPITAIYAGIGRGHPNYLDSVLRYIRQHHLSEYRHIRIVEIRRLSHGLAKVAWSGVESVYRAGSRGGLVSLTYSRLRTRHPGYNHNSFAARLLGRDLRTRLNDYDGICLVAHPLLAAILQPDHRVFYLHGEIAAPRESAVRGVERTYVPLAETKAKMIARGVVPDSLLETGLVLEPEMRCELEATIQRRRQRVTSGNPLTIGFFISGAYPRRHAAQIVAATHSCLEAGHRVRLFWGSNQREVGRFAESIRRFCDRVAIDESPDRPISTSPCVIVTAPTREEETIRSLAYLPDCDLFCAAPHERVNWAVGAGLPMVMIGPPIGSYAPENRGYLLRAGCGVEFSSTEAFAGFGRKVDTLRTSGELTAMLDAGCHVKSVDGARVIAEELMQMAH